MNSDVFIVIPAYNEASMLRGVVGPLIKNGYTVVVVNDGSRDDTVQVAEQLPVCLLTHAINLGQGAALQSGMEYALKLGARFIVHFDADGQHDANDIPGLLEPLRLGQADIALGSRFLRSSDSDCVPSLRRVILKCGVIVNYVLTGLWLTDAHNGLRAMTAEAAARIRLQQHGAAHASEILAQIRSRQLVVVECPARVLYSKYSMSKGQSLWNSINIVFDLLVGKVLR